MKKLPKEKRFDNGQIVHYSHPSNFMVRAFGRRVFYASSDSSSLEDEYQKAIDGPGDVGVLDMALGAEATPPDEGFGMILCSCFESRHGSGTWYYKVLLGERLYWIASEHLMLKFC